LKIQKHVESQEMDRRVRSKRCVWVEKERGGGILF